MAQYLLPKLNYRDALLPALSLRFGDVGKGAVAPIKELRALFHPGQFPTDRLEDEEGGRKRTMTAPGIPLAGGIFKTILSASFRFASADDTGTVDLKIRSAERFATEGEANWVLAQLQALQVASGAGPGAVMLRRDLVGEFHASVHPLITQPAGHLALENLEVSVPLEAMRLRMRELEEAAFAASKLLQVCKRDPGEILDWMTRAAENANMAQFTLLSMMSDNPIVVEAATQHWHAVQRELNDMPAWMVRVGITLDVNDAGRLCIHHESFKSPVEIPRSTWSPSPTAMVNRWTQRMRAVNEMAVLGAAPAAPTAVDHAEPRDPLPRERGG